jgi:excisionase family DNA binding protein
LLLHDQVMDGLHSPPRPATGSVNGGLLTADEVGELLGVPKTWVYEQSRAGRIPTVSLGRYRRYRREAIEQWVRELEAAVGVGGGAARSR